MTDTRARISPTAPVNLAQLNAEMGGVGLGRNEETGEIVAPEGVTRDALEAALAAHVPEPEQEVDVQVLLDRLAAVEARLDKAASAAVTGDAAKLRDNLKPVL